MFVYDNQFALYCIVSGAIQNLPVSAILNHFFQLQRPCPLDSEVKDDRGGVVIVGYRHVGENNM